VIRDLGGLANLVVRLSNPQFQGGIFAGLNKEAFDKVPSNRYVYPQCVAPTVQHFQLLDPQLSFQLHELTLAMPRGSSSSPLAVEATAALSALLNAVATYHDAAVGVLQGYLRAQAAPAATDLGQAWLATQADAGCPAQLGHSTTGQNVGLIIPWLGHFFLVVAAILAALGGLSLVGTQWYLDKLALVGRKPAQGPRVALAVSEAVPVGLRVTVPLLLGACVFCLLGSNFLPMAETFVSLEQGGSAPGTKTATEVYQVVVYSLLYNIQLLYSHPSVWWLAYVVAIFSGVFPYVKLGGICAGWCMGETWLTSRWRGRVLLLLDQAGKLALVDIFMIQYISAALRVRVALTDAGAGGDSVSVVLRTDGEIGLTVFVVATVGSLALGHLCLYYHERDRRTRLDLLGGVSRVSLNRASLFLRKSRSVYELDAYAAGRSRAKSAALVASAVLIFVGMHLPAATIRLDAPVSLDRHGTTFSMWGFAWLIPHLSSRPGSFAAVFAQVTYVVFVLVTVHCHLGLLLVGWFGRVPSNLIRSTTSLAHTLFAWSATDVALGTMVLVLAGISSVDSVTLSPDMLDVLASLTGEQPAGNGVRVRVAFGAGVWVLAAGLALHGWIGRVVMGHLEAANVLQSMREDVDRCREQVEREVEQEGVEMTTSVASPPTDSD